MKFTENAISGLLSFVALKLFGLTNGMAVLSTIVVFAWGCTCDLVIRDG